MAIVTCVAGGADAAGLTEGLAADAGVRVAAAWCPQFVLAPLPVPLDPLAPLPEPLAPGRPLVPCDPDVPGAEEAGVILAQA